MGAVATDRDLDTSSAVLGHTLPGQRGSRLSMRCGHFCGEMEGSRMGTVEVDEGVMLSVQQRRWRSVPSWHKAA